MPQAAERQTRAPESEADVRTLIIGPGVSVKGEITSCNRLIVEGKIEAKLADCPNVIIKEGGVFNGESTTEDADVQGSFDGILVARKRLLVRATGRVSGTISYGELEIERGGKISGEISQNGESAPLRLKPAQVA
jgi:cytoskeletal protein CcmA (bactofilin family)